jgi:hypothetical protein
LASTSFGQKHFGPQTFGQRNIKRHFLTTIDQILI